MAFVVAALRTFLWQCAFLADAAWALYWTSFSHRSVTLQIQPWQLLPSVRDPELGCFEVRHCDAQTPAVDSRRNSIIHAQRPKQ